MGLCQHLCGPLVQALAVGLRHHGRVGVDFGGDTQHQFAGKGLVRGLSEFLARVQVVVHSFPNDCKEEGTPSFTERRRLGPKRAVITLQAACRFPGSWEEFHRAFGVNIEGIEQRAGGQDY